MAAFTPFSSPLSPSVPPVSSGNKRSTSCRKKFPTVVEKRREGPREGDRQTGDAARAVAAAEARKVESHRTELKPIMWAGFRSAVAGGRGGGSRLMLPQNLPTAQHDGQQSLHSYLSFPGAITAADSAARRIILRMGPLGRSYILSSGTGACAARRGAREIETRS